MSNRFKNIVILSLLFISGNCFSQGNEKFIITDITKATFFNPGISYEKAIGKFQTVYAQAFMNTSIGLGYSSSMGNTSSIHFDPALTIQYRYYYNFTKREAKGKRTVMNSLNYVCPVYQLVFSKERIDKSHYYETYRRAMHSVGLAWGLQRNFKNRISLDLVLGGVYLFAKATIVKAPWELTNETAGKFGTLGQFNVGFWLNKRD